MLPLFRVSLRNVVRQRGRTLSALTAIGFGVVAVLIAGGFIGWVLSEMRELSIRTWYGHLQVAREGFWERGASDPAAFHISSEPAAIARLRSDPRVAVVAPRLRFAALVSHDDTTLSFIGEGVDPRAEAEFGRSLIFLKGRGHNLSPDASNGVVVGQGLAANLGASLGDPLVLLANTPSGGVNAAEGSLHGIFLTTNAAFDDATIRLPLALAQSLLRVGGVDSWTILLNDSSDTATLVAELRAALAPEGLEVRPWYELADTYLRTEALFERQLGAIAVVLGLLIVLGISNTMTMNVIERTAEIGTSMALGATRRDVLLEFVAEGTWLGLLGAGAGVCIAIPLAWLLSWVGIPLPPPPGLDTPILAEIRLSRELVALGFGIAVVSTVLATIYPALRASRLPIIDALRTAHV